MQEGYSHMQIPPTKGTGNPLNRTHMRYNQDDNSLPQLTSGLVATKNKSLPVLFRTYEGNVTDIRAVEQLIADIKRVDLSIDAIIMDREMASRINLITLDGDDLKLIAGIPLTSNDAKEQKEIIEKLEFANALF